MWEDEVAEHRAQVVRHRESVVQRLLAKGLSATTLMALLPDFRPVVQRTLEQD